MRVTALSPVGAIVTGIRIDALSESQVADVEGLLAQHGVIVMPDSDGGDEAFLRFLRSFGEMEFTVGETPVAEFPDLNVVSNVGRTTPPRSFFHTDTSYVRRPPAYTALRAVTLPQRGDTPCSPTSTVPMTRCPRTFARTSTAEQSRMW